MRNVETAIVLKRLAGALMLSATMSCAQFETAAGVTDRPTAVQTELCESWGRSLATRSRTDTARTQADIGRSYAVFITACPGFEHLVPQ